MMTVSSICEGSYESKGSKFFSFLFPFTSFQEILKDLKKSHPKAVHFVSASRSKEIQIIESFSDDGEPKGSSGVPTLNVLRGENLIDVGLITVRYFGGTLLGVGGLVRAYTQSAQDVLRVAKEKDYLIPHEKYVDFFLTISYSHFNQVQYWINFLKIEILEKTFQSQDVRIYMRSTQEKKDEFEKFYTTKFGFF